MPCISELLLEIVIRLQDCQRISSTHGTRRDNRYFTCTMEVAEPEPALMTVNDLQQQHQPNPDVVRAHKSGKTRQTDNNDDLIRRLYRPPPDEYYPYKLCNMHMPAGLVVEHKQWTPHRLQSRILRVLKAPFLEAKM